MNVSPVILGALLFSAAAAAGGCDVILVEEGFEPEPVEASAKRAAPDAHSLYGRLQSSDKDVRMEAILQAGRLKDAKAVPYLVDRLDDCYCEVRFAAIVALEKITGTSRGYRYWAPASARKEAVARWRNWLNEGSSAWAIEDPG